MKLKICFHGKLLPYSAHLPNHLRSFVCQLALLITFLVSIRGNPAFAQEPLQIGERLPDFAITNLVNYTGGRAQVADFSKHLLIIDFINIYCGNCIAALPHLDSLQQQYKGSLQILVVCTEDGARVRKFLANNLIAKTVALPVATGDREFSALFPHTYVPHEVWIFKDTVRAITGSEYVTSKNILKILSQPYPSWSVKTDRPSFNYHAPLLNLYDRATAKSEIGKEPVYTAIGGHIEGVATKYVRDTDLIHHLTAVRYINFDLLDLYLSTLNPSDNFAFSHVLIRSPQPDHFIYRNNPMYRDEWNRKYTFCYEGFFGTCYNAAAVNAKIRNDLDHHFKMNSRIIDTLVESMELCRITPDNRKIALIGSSDTDRLNFISIADLVKRLNHDFIGLPFRTNLPPDLLIDVYLSPDAFKNTKSLSVALLPYHLALRPCKKKLPMLILTDALSYSPTNLNP